MRQEPAEKWAPAMRPELTVRGQLERTVRACATGAGDEADFVRQVRARGLRIRPRFATGRGDQVAGYSVALRPEPSQAPIWHGGGRLAKDLTLPRLREGWPNHANAAAAAVPEWTAAARSQPPTAAVETGAAGDPELWAGYSRQLGALRDRLRDVAPSDRATWAQVAGDAAGVFAAWSLRSEAQPGPLAAAASALGRSAQLHAWQARPARRVLGPSARAGALLMAAAAQPSNGALGWSVLLRQMANLAKAVHDAHQAVGELDRAREIEALARGQLAEIAQRLETVQDTGRPALDEQALAAAQTASRGQLSARQAGSPLPQAPAQPPARPAVQRPPVKDRDRDVNR